MPDVTIAKTLMKDGGSVGEHISAMAQAILREQTRLAKHFRDVSAFAVKGVDKITFPGIGSFAVANRAHGATNEKQAPPVFKDSLNLDQNAYIKYGIDGSSEIQSTLNWKLECAKIAAEDHVDYFEEKLFGVLSTYAQAVNVTVEEGEVSETSQLVALRKAYRKAKGKLELALFVISEELEAKILANPKIFAHSVFGAPLIQDGVIKKLYGIDVEVKLMETSATYLCQKNVVNYGFQLAPNYAEQKDINFGTHGLLCAMDQLFGVGASYVVADVGSPINGKSKLIFKVGTVTLPEPEETP